MFILNSELIPKLRITSLNLEFELIKRSSDRENTPKTLVDMEPKISLGSALNLE